MRSDCQGSRHTQLHPPKCKSCWTNAMVLPALSAGNLNEVRNRWNHTTLRRFLLGLYSENLLRVSDIIVKRLISSILPKYLILWELCYYSIFRSCKIVSINNSTLWILHWGDGGE